MDCETFFPFYLPKGPNLAAQLQSNTPKIFTNNFLYIANVKIMAWKNWLGLNPKIDAGK